MAWRIHDSVIRGEIDNRERGVVRGRLWLDGLNEPLVLQLRGNACPDLAGCLLTFRNPGKTVPLRSEAQLDPVQSGTIGDLTASRKVRVPDVPIQEFLALSEKGQPAPEHWANCLYLEWFSEANGRVVVESSDYELSVSPPAWRLTPAEEEQRRATTEHGWEGFLEKLDQALEHQKHEPPEDKVWDEFDYEKLLRESDARTDKMMELFDKYRDHPDRERLIAAEMGWVDSDSEDSSDADEREGESADEEEELDVDEMNRICAEAAEQPLEPEPTTEGIDWVRTEDGDIKHPLSLRAFESSVALWKQCEELGEGPSEDPDLTTLVSEFQITGAKLAGALNSLAYGRNHREGAFIVAYLKRALGHLHAAQAALAKVASKKLLPTQTETFARNELFAIRQEILRLMQEFRKPG